MELNLFSQLVGAIAIHKATQSPVIIKSYDWYNNQMDFEVLVPMIDEKGKIEFCNAVYSQNELVL